MLACSRLAALFGLLFSLTLRSQVKQEADLVLLDGKVYTVDAARSWADAIAVRDGRIVYVGTDSKARDFIGPRTSVIHLNGKMVLPGFRDSHLHPVNGGLMLDSCRLDDMPTPEAVLSAVRSYFELHRSNQWITGAGWDLHVFPDANPRKETLDAVVGNHPAYLEAMDGHSAWVNSAALRLAGIGRDTSDPPGGHIERDPVTHEPTGTLRESATRLVARLLPKPTPADRRSGLRKVLKMAAGYGVTSLDEANATPEILETYAELGRQNELTALINASLNVNPALGTSQIPALVRLRALYSGKDLRANAAKLFVDGVIESHTAALLKPYLDRAGDAGEPNYSPDTLNHLAAALDARGFQLHMHAIGDRAVRMALDACAYAQHVNGRHDARDHIAHLELVDSSDITRFAALGVVADFEALWAYADRDITVMTEPRLGPERSRWLYPIRSVAATGAVIVGGSDWPVTSMNPLEAIQVAATRCPPQDACEEPWIPEERTDVRTMIAAYTINGAYLDHEESDTGSIETGKRADLIVLDRNILEIDPRSIHTVRVLYTFFSGKAVGP